MVLRMDFDGKVLIVTGAARGMGRAVAERLATLRARVCLIDRGDNIYELKSKMKTEGFNVDAYLCDVSDRHEVNHTIKKIVDKHKTIDGLVNVAGISASISFLDDAIDTALDNMMKVNFYGVWNTCRAVLPIMVEKKAGSIVNFSSVTGNVVSDGGMAAYAASKGAVSGLTRSLAVEFADKNININSILPGYVWTDMLAKYDVTNPERVKVRLAGGIPAGRLGQVEEIAELAVFLLSSKAKFINGQNIVVDGASSLVETKQLIPKGNKPE